jgi:hypothetical protein
MRRRLHNLLLILVTLSVAIAPLRGALALPEATPTHSENHCAGMQHDMQQMNHQALHGDKTDSKPHRCKSGCNGSCCDQDCNACLHATAAITPSPVALRDTRVNELGLPVADNFPERHLKPPLRPPLTHHS